MSQYASLAAKEAYEYSAGYLEMPFIKGYHKHFMIFTVFADESYNEQRKPTVIVIAGWLVAEDKWEQFCKKWQSVLNEYRVGCFHFVEFAQDKHKNYKKTPYDGWTNTEKDNLLYSLALSACDCGFPMGGAWEAEKLTKDSIRTAYRTFFTSLSRMAKTIGKPEDKAKFIFDSNQDDNWLIPRAEALREFVGDKLPFKNGINSESPKEFLHLQAADLYAFAMRQNAERFYKKGDKQKMQPRLLDLILEKNRHDSNNGKDFTSDKWVRLMCLVIEHRRQWLKSNKGVYYPFEHCPFLKKDGNIIEQTSVELRSAATRFYQNLTSIWRS